MSHLALYLFGTPRIERDGAAVTVERRKSLALLAYLAVTGQPHSRYVSATPLGVDFDDERAPAGLRRSLVDLNATLGKGWVNVEGDQLVSLCRVRPAARMSGAFMPLWPPLPVTATRLSASATPAALMEAANLYTADFLAGFTWTMPPGSTLADLQTERLRLELAGVLEKLAPGLAGRQEWDAAIGHARRALALHPLA